jgi:hypothetical protein
MARTLIRRGLIAAAICTAQAAATAPHVLSPERMRIVAAQTLRAGDTSMARIFAKALLKRDSKDTQARLILAKAEAMDGDTVAAMADAKRAHIDASDDDAKYYSARQVAHLLHKDGKHTRAGWWLRRSYQFAPDDAAATRSQRDFQIVKAANPLQVKLAFATSPSSNVNNGSSADTIEIFGLPFELSPDAQALSGWVTTLGVKADYRLQNGMIAGVSFETSDKRLSAEAMAAAPGAEGSDYDTTLLAFRLGKSFDLADGKVFGEASIGQSWFGGSKLSHFAKLSAYWQRPLDERSKIGFGATVEHSMPDRAGGATSTTFGATANWTRHLDAGVLSLNSGLATTRADLDDSENTVLQLGARWSPKDKILGGNASVYGKLEYRDFPTSALDADGRQDTGVTIGASLHLTQYDYMGFSPTIGVEARHIASNVSLYDREEYGLSIGIKSAF